MKLQMDFLVNHSDNLFLNGTKSHQPSLCLGTELETHLPLQVGEAFLWKGSYHFEVSLLTLVCQPEHQAHGLKQ